jgi:hypothetical protein
LLAPSQKPWTSMTCMGCFTPKEPSFTIICIYEFIWPFDSAKMLQISKFSAFFDPNSLLDFSVSIWPRPSTEVSMFISRTHRFWCYNANLCSINTNGAITIWLSFKFEFY